MFKYFVFPLIAFLVCFWDLGEIVEAREAYVINGKEIIIFVAIFTVVYYVGILMEKYFDE